MPEDGVEGGGNGGRGDGVSRGAGAHQRPHCERSISSSRRRHEANDRSDADDPPPTPPAADAACVAVIGPRKIQRVTLQGDPSSGCCCC